MKYFLILFMSLGLISFTKAQDKKLNGDTHKVPSEKYSQAHSSHNNGTSEATKATATETTKEESTLKKIVKAPGKGIGRIMGWGPKHYARRVESNKEKVLLPEDEKPAFRQMNEMDQKEEIEENYAKINNIPMEEPQLPPNFY